MKAVSEGSLAKILKALGAVDDISYIASRTSLTHREAARGLHILCERHLATKLESGPALFTCNMVVFVECCKQETQFTKPHKSNKVRMRKQRMDLFL